jgi:hypothetical protein
MLSNQALAEVVAEIKGQPFNFKKHGYSLQPLV